MYYVYCCGGLFSGIYAICVICGLVMALDFVQKHWIFFVAIPGAIVGIFLLFLIIKLLIKLISFIVSSIKERRRFNKYCHENFYIIAGDYGHDAYRPYQE
jgi:hypothetical protein